MQELLIVNPARRPSKRRKSTKRASPAQRRARAAFAAAARARSSNPKKRRARRRAAPAISVMSNPRRRRRSVARKVHHRRRRNPLHIGSVKPMSILTPALMGALGGVAVNTILGKLPIPASMMTGRMRYVTQAGAALALAVLGSKLGKSRYTTQMAEGSLTITLHQAIVDLASGAGMNLSGMGYYLPGYRPGAVPSPHANAGMMAMNGMGKYVSGPGSRNVVPMAAPRQAMRGFAKNF